MKVSALLSLDKEAALHKTIESSFQHVIARPGTGRGHPRMNHQLFGNLGGLPRCARNDEKYGGHDEKYAAMTKNEHAMMKNQRALFV